MPQPIRTFIAIESTPTVRRRADELIAALKTADADVKWVAPEHMHVTLNFLGDVPAERLDPILRATAAAALQSPAFDLEVHGAGAFPNLARPRTIFLAMREGQDLLVPLQQRLTDALAELGLRPEHRKFQAHLTIGRVRSFGPQLKTLSSLLHNCAEFAAGRMPVDELVVFSSKLRPAGPLHEPLARVQLASAREG